LKDGSTGLRTAITVGALAATLIGWAVLSGDSGSTPVAPTTVQEEARVAFTSAPFEGSPASDPSAASAAGAAGEPPPMPSLVSVDTRPLPPRRAPLPRPDVRTRASARIR